MGYFTTLRRDVFPAVVNDIPVSPEFSLASARTMLWAAQAAYEGASPARLMDLAATWGWTNLTALTPDGSDFPSPVASRGFSARAGQTTIISFTGTEPDQLRDLITNFNILRTADGEHTGFKEGVASVWPAIRTVVARAPAGIVLTGHSLGAALAATAAQRLLNEHAAGPEKILAVYTYGMPRTGYVEWANAYDAPGGLGEKTFRLVHGDDLVTKVPPASVLGFRHVGRYLACPSGGLFRGVPAPAQTEAPPFDQAPPAASWLPAPLAGPAYPAENFPAVLAAAALPAALRDHLPDRYLRALGVTL